MKKILFSLIGTAIVGTPICSYGVDYLVGYEGKFDLDYFNSIKVTNNEFIQGADVSTYANVLESYLFQNNIFESESDSSVKKYTYNDFEEKCSANTNETVQEYLDKHVFSYVNEDGSKVYDNMFKILKLEGINSIRLRLWVDPTDEKGNSYGGGHNDLNTDIYIIKEAIKNGITDFLIDFHFSDFWADPNRQFRPKAWENMNMSQLKTTLSTYTYDSIEKIYDETGYLPARVEVGNEITKGFMWKNNKVNNYSDATQYLIAANEGINNAEKDVIKKSQNDDETNHFVYKDDYHIKRILHLESSGTHKFNKAIKSYFSNKKLYNMIDTVGLTFYPFDSGTPERLFSVIRDIKKKYKDKSIIICEFSLSYTTISSDKTGDSPKLGDAYNDKLPSKSPEDQLVLMYDYMQALSRALPDEKTGFYWWEPAWLSNGGMTWATQSGINYAFSNNSKKRKSSNQLSNWSNQGLFDQNGMILPVADIIKQFSRMNNFSEENYKLLDAESLLDRKVKKYNFFSLRFSKSNFLKKVKIPFEKNWKKRNISCYLYDSDGKWNDELYIYTDSNDENKIINEIKNKIRIQYKSLLFTQININIDLKTNIVSLHSKDDSFYYEGDYDLKLKINKYESDDFVINNNLNISKHDNNWESKIFNTIKEDDNYKKNNNDNGNNNLFWDYLNINGGISDKVWLYDNSKKIDRYSDYYFLANTKVRYSADDSLLNTKNKKGRANLDLVKKNKLKWPSYLEDVVDKDGFVYFSITPKIESDSFMKYGSDSWHDICILTFKIKIDFI